MALDDLTAKSGITREAAVYVPITSLVPWAKNPRRNDAAVERVAASISRFGFGAPLLARRDGGEIIAGHTRLRAAASLGMDEVPVRYLDLSEADAHALALADNRLGELATWDDVVLRDVLASIASEDRQLIGFARGIVAEEATLETLEGAAESDAGIPVSESVSGTVYHLGPHRLVCGDSTSRAVVDSALGGDAPLLQIADPPYEMPYESWAIEPSVHVLGVWWRSRSALSWVAGLDDAWGVHTLVFTGGSRGQINLTLPCCQHEQVMVARRKWWDRKEDAIDRGVVRASGAAKTADDRHLSHQAIGGGGAGTGMAWQKPALQFALLCAYVPAGSVVWDPCAGSGASLIAAATHGRVWRGAEMDPARVDAIRRRWGQHARDLGQPIGDGL